MTRESSVAVVVARRSGTSGYPPPWRDVRLQLALALSLLLALSAHAAETCTARVVSVADGDTFGALHDSHNIVVRLRWTDRWIGYANSVVEK
jgi:hypothetical protein